MPTTISQIDAKQLIQWLGVEGTKAGLLNSKLITINVLRRIAESLCLKIPEKITRHQLIEEIVKVASRKIDKSTNELLAMDEQTLLNYFEDIDVELSEVLDVLKEFDLNPPRESRRSILEFAAKELSETGRFMRIAGTNK